MRYVYMYDYDDLIKVELLLFQHLDHRKSIAILYALYIVNKPNLNLKLFFVIF